MFFTLLLLSVMYMFCFCVLHILFFKCIFIFFSHNVTHNINFFLILIENLALGGHTWQQHPFSRSDSGENAVNGLYDDRSQFGHQCTLSDNYRYTAEWRVDLGSVVSISHVNIFYRTDNLPSMNIFFDC